MDRRKFLLRAGALGCSAAASPLVTPVAFADAPWEGRLVVVLLRGAMDGLDVLRPTFDPAFAGLRDGLMTGAGAGGIELADGWLLHPGLADLAPLWRAGELSFAHAVSTPYRDRRSHFDGQDMLEAGSAAEDRPERDGWLNRMLTLLPGVEARTAYALDQTEPLILKGEAPYSQWSPRTRLALTPQAQRLLELVQGTEPMVAAASARAIEIAAQVDAEAEMAEETEDMMAEMGGVTGNGAHLALARFAATRLRGDTRVAAFSLNGWDTHARQVGMLNGALRRLSETILTLKAGLGPVWDKTAVLFMTEFGRTVRPNGTGGTDHGTGGAMVMAGGALRGRQVVTDWPGLDEADLYRGRDLMPTRDVRAMAAWVMRGLVGLERGDLERVVFPGLDMGDDPRLIA